MSAVAAWLPGVEALNTLMSDAFGAIGCDVRLGTKLPTLFAEAGIGEPDGSDIAGALTPLGPSRVMLEQTVRAVLPAVTARGLVDPERAESVLTALADEAERHPDRPLLPPLLVSAWKRKPVNDSQ